MPIFLTRWLLVLQLLGFAAMAQGQIVVLDPALQGMALGGYLQYQIDRSGKARVEEMAGRDDWQPVLQDVPNFGLSAQVYWLRLELQVADTAAPWLLELGYNLLDHVDIYSLDENGSVLNLHKTGMRRVRGASDYVHRVFVVPVQAPRPGVMALYFRVQSWHGMQFPLRLWPVDEFIARDEADNLALGIFFGAICVLLLYNFFLFSVLRDRLYLIYSAMVLAIMLFHFQMRGISLRFIWPGWIEWNAAILVGSGMLTIFFASLFTDRFLRLGSSGFILLIPLRTVRWFCLLAAFMSPWVNTELGVFLLVGLTSITATLSLLAVFHCFHANDRSLVLFMAGWLVLMAGVLLITGNKLALLPYNLITEHAISVGTLIELMLFSMAMGEQVNSHKSATLRLGAQRLAGLQAEQDARARQLQTETMQRTASEISLRLQTGTNGRLEQEVVMRDADIEAAGQRLQELMRIDALTGMYSRSHFNDRLREEHDRAARGRQPLNLLLVDIDQFQQINAQMGFRISDDLLHQAATLIQNVVRHHSSGPYRFEDSVFAVLLPGVSAQRALTVADLICTSCRQQRFLLAGNELEVSVSVGGGSMVPSPGGRPEALVQLAAAKLQLARQAGGDCIQGDEPAPGQKHA